jgi:hypothetical protein
MSAQAKAATIDLSKYPDHALIREAEGLTVDEKVLLYTVASHKSGVSFATVDTLRQWTGLSRNRYYKARQTLLAKSLLSEQRSLGGATTYRLRTRPLQRLARQGIARRREAKQRRAALATSAPPEGVLVLDTTPAHDRHGSRVGDSDATRARSEHPKMNEEPNHEDIKNEKPRRVRPPRRAVKWDVKGSVAEVATTLGADRQEQIRARIAQQRGKWQS